MEEDKEKPPKMQSTLKTGYCGEGRRELKMEKHTCKNGKHQKRVLFCFFFSKTEFSVDHVPYPVCRICMYTYVCMYV